MESILLLLSGVTYCWGRFKKRDGDQSTVVRCVIMRYVHLQGRVFGTEWNRLISLVQKYFFIGCAKKNLGKIWKISQKIPQKSSFFDIFNLPLEMYTRVLENCYALRTFRYSQGRNAIEKCVCWRICFKYFFWKNESVKTHTYREL